MKFHRKRRYQRAVRFNVTLPPSLVPRLERLILRHSFNGPSDYLQARIRKDTGLDLKAT